MLTGNPHQHTLEFSCAAREIEPPDKISGVRLGIASGALNTVATRQKYGALLHVRRLPTFFGALLLGEVSFRLRLSTIRSKHRNPPNSRTTS